METVSFDQVSSLKEKKKTWLDNLACFFFVVFVICFGNYLGN